MSEEEKEREEEARREQERLRREEEERRIEQERRDREEREAEEYRKREEERRRQEEEEERRRYLSDKKCAYCTHLDPDKRDGSLFYCSKNYRYVAGYQGACEYYDLAGRSTAICEMIEKGKYNDGSEKEKRECAFCTHLIPDKKNEGRYYCDRIHSYVKGTDTNESIRCNSFEEAGRSTLESELIRDDSETIDSKTNGLETRYCSDCRFYNLDDKKGDGYYTCTKRNQTMPANNKECYMFETSGRSSSESIKVYNEAKNAEKKSKSGNENSLLGIVALILVIGAIIIKVFFS